MARIAVLLSLVACHAETKIGSLAKIADPDTVVSACITQCGTLGLRLESVVLTPNSVSYACRVEER